MKMEFVHGAAAGLVLVAGVVAIYTVFGKADPGSPHWFDVEHLGDKNCAVCGRGLKSKNHKGVDIAKEIAEGTIDYGNGTTTSKNGFGSIKNAPDQNSGEPPAATLP